MSALADLSFQFNGTDFDATAPLGVNALSKAINYALSVTNGTGSNQADLLYVNSAGLVSTTSSLDLAGTAIKTPLATPVAMVEVVALIIHNTSTLAAQVLIVGNGANPAYAGLFGAGTHTITIPAGGIFIWIAPLDGGGLTVTANTGDILKLDSGAQTVTFKIAILGRSA